MTEEPGLSDLSMIMMTANRPRMFREAVKQYALQAPDLRILVADFGEPEAQRQNAAVAETYRDTVHYHRFAPDVPWDERFRRMLDVCVTPYAVPAADDDFLLPPALRECVAFLRSRPEYAACHGAYFTVDRSPVPGHVGLGVNLGFVGRAYDSPDPIGRLIALLFWYQSVYYAVQRRDDLRRARLPGGMRTGAMIELFTASATVIAGKVERLRSPYCLRNGIETDTHARISAFADVIAAGDDLFLEEYLPARAGLSALLRARWGEQRQWGRLIDIAFAGHVRKNWPEGPMWQKLARDGDIPPDDVARLAAPGMESEVTPIDAPYLWSIVEPLAQRGWRNAGA